MNLSQDEINALLNGTAVDGEGYDAGSSDTPAEVDLSDTGTETSLGGAYELSPEEIDTLGEVGNICMGAVATTMYTLLDRRVSITTPRVSVHTTREVLSVYQIPFVVVEVKYIEGIEGKNLLLLKEPDAAIITDVLMGGDGSVNEPIELNELHMSAISEIMNQMIGASATALSKIIQTPVNISTPVSNLVGLDSDVSDMLDYSAVVVKVSFDMEIEGLLKSQLLQLMPFELGCELAAKLIAVNAQVAEENASKEINSADASSLREADTVPPSTEDAAPYYAAPNTYEYASVSNAAPTASMLQGAAPMPPYAYEPPPPPPPGQLVDVRPMQYNSFDSSTAVASAPSGLDLVYDIPLQVSVELGKTKKEISEILEFCIGTVVVLDKIAGDPVEILVNGKLVARGEVVVIDENYGVRITDVFNK